MYNYQYSMNKGVLYLLITMNKETKAYNQILSEEDIFGSEELTINGIDAVIFDKYLDLLNDTHDPDYIEEQENIYYDLLSKLEGNPSKFWII